MEVKVEQRSAAWFSLRKNHLGGSDIAPILGISPWKTALDVYNEKMSPYVDESPKNPWMKRGVDLEPEALQAFTNKTGYLMTPIVMISDSSPFALASFDGYDAMGDKRAVEIKCGGEKAHLLALNGQIPKYYIAQMQHQMYVAELDEIYYCSYRPEHEVNPLYIQIVKRDEAFISDMIEKESAFYYNHMLTGIAPDCAVIAPKLIDSQKWANLAEEYRKIDFIEKDATERKEEIKKELIQLSEEENAKGSGILLQKIERKGIINYQNIPELKTIDLEPFRKPSSFSWRVTEVNNELV